MVGIKTELLDREAEVDDEVQIVLQIRGKRPREEPQVKQEMRDSSEPKRPHMEAAQESTITPLFEKESNDDPKRLPEPSADEPIPHPIAQPLQHQEQQEIVQQQPAAPPAVHSGPRLFARRVIREEIVRPRPVAPVVPPSATATLQDTLTSLVTALVPALVQALLQNPVIQQLIPQQGAPTLAPLPAAPVPAITPAATVVPAVKEKIECVTLDGDEPASVPSPQLPNETGMAAQEKPAAVYSAEVKTGLNDDSPPLLTPEVHLSREFNEDAQASAAPPPAPASSTLRQLLDETIKVPAEDPLHDSVSSAPELDALYWCGHLESKQCPRCNKTVGKGSRRVHCTQFHYDVYFAKVSKNMSRMERWAASRLGSDWKKKRACLHCTDNTNSFDDRIELLQHIQTVHTGEFGKLEMEVKEFARIEHTNEVAVFGILIGTPAK